MKRFVFVCASICTTSAFGADIKMDYVAHQVASDFLLDSNDKNNIYATPTSLLTYRSDTAVSPKITFLWGDEGDQRSLSIMGSSLTGVINDYDWIKSSYAKSINEPELYLHTSSKINESRFFEIDYIWSNAGMNDNGWNTYRHVGYSHYQWNAFGVISEISAMGRTEGQVIFGPSVKALSYETRTIRGMKGWHKQVSQSGNWSMDVKGAYGVQVAVSSDHHYLRPDLSLPSIDMLTVGAAVSAEADVTYVVKDNLELNMGLQTEYGMGLGVARFNNSDGSVGYSRLAQSQFNYGAKVGVTYKF